MDFDRLAEVPDFPRVDDVFCCLGTTIRKAGSQEAFRKVDHAYVLELARVAVRHRASQFLLVTALGADPRAPAPGVPADPGRDRRARDGPDRAGGAARRPRVRVERDRAPGSRVMRVHPR